MELQSIKQKYGIIGNSAAYNNALKIAVRVANTNLSVLITGESGSGKEVFSKIIHNISARKHNNLIAVNCGAIPEGTIDSELFGHEKGAFTGATDKRKGYFETVDTGTIFLDEIGEMPIGTQARLLRVLESGEFIKVGSSKVQKTDVRVVAATNVNLKQSIENGKFREDLFYRLGTVPIKVPSLRERKEDIHLLFRKFASDFNSQYRSEAIKLTDDAVELLKNYYWKGNVRELKNVAEQVSVLSENKIINAQMLAQFLKEEPINKLPALVNNFSNNGNEKYSDREILYKMLFDMKNDINELKRVLFSLMQGNKVSPQAINQILDDNFYKDLTKENKNALESSGNNFENFNNTYEVNDNKNGNSIVIKAKEINANYEVEEVEENLSLAEKEKEMIKKALEKHKGKRKNAAGDLGISERTLYRKIKEYSI